MGALEQGFSRLKFFPAIAAGGLPTLRALAGPFAQVRFCPTGGITASTAPEWLAEPLVTCVGGSWIAKRGETDWTGITARAREAAALRAA
jgi:2-dehydro-3-deoxyphosphogluconate aldolase/(4S)-4-hydroxy-2-oxoglutarate aldolase